MENSVHHIEFGVSDGEYYRRYFIEKYGFSLVARRYCDSVKQFVLKSDKACILVTQVLTDLVQDKFSDATLNNKCIDDPYFVPWNIFQKDYEDIKEDYRLPIVNSVHNVCLKVKDIQKCLKRLTSVGAEIIKPLITVRDEHGEIQTAVVKSCVGNVIHTLIQSDNYNGCFLPQFTEVHSAPVKLTTGKSQLHVTHFDHVTFACNSGSSHEVLKWYEKCFGMKRFLINRDEDEDSGFVIDSDDIGLRLKAFEYWKCAEVGLTAADTNLDSIKFVIAEALPDQGPNQVDTFLTEHGGPGIQHVGLYTNHIVDTCKHLKDCGVEFVEPPYTYYTEVGKLGDINDIGLDPETLRCHGILVDAELEPDNEQSTSSSNRYLMQKFTKPLFAQNTFFLEIIQRVGAKGFGSGNITALWRSVQAYLSEKEQQKTS